MSNYNRVLPMVAITGSSIMVGCSGHSYGSCGSYGSYGSYGSCGAPYLTTGGVYEGTLTGSTNQQENPVVAIIAENGDGRMSGQDGTYYRLNVGNQGTYVTGSFAGYSQGANFPNGTQSATGAVTGVLTTTPVFNAALTLTDTTGHAAAVSLNIDNVYNLGSSLPTLAGSWSSNAGGFNLTAIILADGTFTATDSNNCTYTGSFGLLDSNFDAYSENYVRSCNGTNITFDGLSSFFPAAGSGAAATKAHIKLLADDHAQEYLIVDLQ